MTEVDFLEAVWSNEFNVELLRRLRSIDLPECHLTAGCLFQAVWNRRSGHPPAQGIKDYDVFYFDNGDLSWEAEDEVIRQVSKTTANLPISIEVKNQARVHLWYSRRFGGDYPPLKSAQDGIDRYLISCTCVGIDARSGHVYAPNGFGEMEQGILRMNPHHPSPDLFRRKAESYRSRWPWLTIEG